MNPYAPIDDAITACVTSLGTTLFSVWGDQPARYFHVSGDPPFECFQISIAAPTNGSVIVWARAIDTNDGTGDYMERCWEGPVADFAELLASAVARVDQWRGRERFLPDPPSPW